MTPGHYISDRLRGIFQKHTAMGLDETDESCQVTNLVRAIQAISLLARLDNIVGP